MPRSINENILAADVTAGQEGGAGYAAETSYVDYQQRITAEQLDRLIQDNRSRRKLSKAIFAVTVLWMFSVLAILVVCGLRGLVFSDAVLITLITTTTANVFGFMYVVVNYLFNKEKST